MKEIGRKRKNLKNDLKRLHNKRIFGSSSEGQGYADKRKRKTLSRYRRLQRKGLKDNIREQDQSREASDIEDIPSSSLTPGRESQTSIEDALDSNMLPAKSRLSGSGNRHRYSNAQKEYQERLTAKQQKAKVRQEERMKREGALEVYKKKKVQRNKLFSQKSKRGQPIMKHRIDFLLEKLKAEGD